MSPTLLAIVLGTGLLALVPTGRLARRDPDRWTVAGYFIVVWLLLATVALAPGLARLTVPVLVVLVVAPWIDVRGALDRLLGRPPRERGPRGRPPRERGPREHRPPHDRQPPPRNVTPPEVGGPWNP